MKIKTLCLADQSFQKSFPDYKLFIREIISYINVHLKNSNTSLSATIKSWDTKNIKKTYKDHLKNMFKNTKKYDLVIGFTNKKIFWDHPLWCGINYEKNIMIGNFFPIKIPFLYRYGLKKLTLHELGHFLGLNDSFFIKFSIMDNFFGIFASRFTKKQLATIRKVK